MFALKMLALSLRKAEIAAQLVAEIIREIQAAGKS